MPPEIAVSKDFLMIKIWHEKFDFEPQISGWKKKPDNHFGTKGVFHTNHKDTRTLHCHFETLVREMSHASLLFQI